MSPLKLRNASYLECHLKTEQLCLVSRLFLQVLSHINILIMWLLNKKQWFFNSSTIWKGNVKTISEVFIWMVTAFKWRSSIDLFYLQKPVPTHRLDIILHAVWKKEDVGCWVKLSRVRDSRLFAESAGKKKSISQENGGEHWSTLSQ